MLAQSAHYPTDRYFHSEFVKPESAACINLQPPELRSAVQGYRANCLNSVRKLVSRNPDLRVTQRPDHHAGDSRHIFSCAVEGGQTAHRRPLVDNGIKGFDPFADSDPEAQSGRGLRTID